jgi:hypothetical protein
MRKLYFLILLLTGIPGFAFMPPPVINNPAPLTVCDLNNDGTEIFDLTPVIPEVLGALDPSLYTVSFHDSITDANNDANPITGINAFSGSNGQVLFVRVEENAAPANFSTAPLELTFGPITPAGINGPLTVCGGGEVTVAFQASWGGAPFTFTYSVNGGPVLTVVTPFLLNGVGVNLPSISSGTYDILLITAQSSVGCPTTLNVLHHIDVLPVPTAGFGEDLSIEQIPFVGTAVFNLTVNDAPIRNNNPNAIVTYYTSLSDAQAPNNPITSAAAFSGTNGQIIYARVEENGNGCIDTTSFNLFITNPDIVFIPDANFKSALVSANVENGVAQDLSHNFTIVDTNGDGEIQYSEAANISLLNVANRSIEDLTGLEAFMNITSLNAGLNHTLIDINVQVLPLLEDLSIPQCNLYTLDLSNNPNLRQLSCESNNFSTLDFSHNPFLYYIHAQANRLTSINLTGLTALTDLSVANNLLTSIDLTGFPNLMFLNVVANGLTSLSLQGLGMLQELACDENGIDSLDTTDCPNLVILGCSTNQMTYLDVSSSTGLVSLNCSNNTLQNLDLGSNSVLCTFNCFGNNALQTLNIKNGVDSCYTNFNVSDITNSLLQFCCDDNEVAYFRNYFLIQQGIDVNVNSYCSFTPGGDYNTIAAYVKFDGNGNGCDVDDMSFPNIRLNINDNTNSGATFTNIDGAGFFYTQAGNFTINPAIENPTWYTISPPSVSVPFSTTDNNVSNQYFCIEAVGVHPDLEIVITPLSAARPGFDAFYKIVCRNKGNQTITHTNDGMSFLFDPNRMNFVEASEPLSLILAPPGTLNWDLINLHPLESKSIFVTLHVNAPTHPTNPVNIGDVLTFDGISNPIAGDEIPSDNTFQYNQTVVGSFDPNEIICLEGNIVSPIEIGNYLHYTINFENTGTAAAENIVVRDVIDINQFDLSSLQLLDSSASVTTRISGNIAEFIFPSINLHSGGHGNILLKIRTNSTLVEGNSVSKRANIYFDYNFPIETIPENTIFQALKNPDIPVDASISVYPNPTKGTINITADNTIKSVQLYDMQGRILQTSLVNENQTAIDISGQSNGMYFLKVISDKGIGVQKVVRE